MLHKLRSFNYSVKLSLLAVLLLTGLPVYAATDYVFANSGGNFPDVCSRYSKDVYHCSALVLGDYDTISIMPSTANAKVEIKLIVAANLEQKRIFGSHVQINADGAADLTLTGVAIELGSYSVFNADVNSLAIIIGNNSTGTGSLTSTAGAILIGSNSRFNGNITTGLVGVVTIGHGTHITGNITAMTVGAITLFDNSTVCGNITSGLLGAVVVGGVVDQVFVLNHDGNVQVSGYIKLGIPLLPLGAVTIGSGSKIGGAVTALAIIKGTGTEIKSKNVTRCKTTITICDKGTTKEIKPTDFKTTDESSSYYLGACNALACTNAPTNTQPANCTPAKPGIPAPLLPEDFTAPTTCAGDISTNSINHTTIKRATIINATTTGDAITYNSNTDAKYGEKVSGKGTMDLSEATVDRGQATGVKLTNVTLNNVYIDSTSVTGGTTTSGTITKGMITEGIDSAKNSAVRGSIESGSFTSPITNAVEVATQGRRTTGTLTNATIEDASTTTVNGVTVVDRGTITSGTITGASTFGTVTNATLTDKTITSANSCFSSGTVGQHGQLNWKEVVKP